ncbi:MAG TPA: class I SAM-dependent methyltransferase [Burkholderiaceae bacterium]|jgi:23S rRNA (cytosine1962-C5)-methyltransferase|nr:class I SAM-dependent methyltransferase [Burkholderiaceae bacterium]
MKPTGELVLKAGKERSLARRHPWIYDTAVARVLGRPQTGDLVAVRGADGAWLAWAAYAPASTLRARCWSFVEAEEIDAAWFAGRVRAAVARRAHLAPQTDAVRLVFGEADGLPGFVADRYGEQLVVQLQAAGAEANRDALIEALVQATGCGNVFDRSDSATRQREGLAPASGSVRGAEPPELIDVQEHGVRYLIDVRRGHKTGFYIDQRDNRRLAYALAQRCAAGRALRVLNCFAYTGGFSLAAALGGAAAVLSIETSAEALALAQRQWTLNGLPDAAARWRQADVFDALRALRDSGESFDLIVLDPPKFAASHRHVERAARAYKDINLNALRLLAPGGYLLTFSCSGAIDVDLFQKIVAGAVIDAGIDCQMLGRLGAGEDHPLAMTHPEGEYLKGLLLRRM